MNGVAMQRRIWGAVIAFGGLLNGCAVLTIDVDVYKGSLINEEHVQMHQLLALAEAAKPMLVQLRDSIEWPTEEMPTSVAEDEKEWYRPGYIQPPEPMVPPEKGYWCKHGWLFWCNKKSKYNFFQNKLAVRVNEVLGLYEDLDPSGKILALQKDKEAKGLTSLTDRYLRLSDGSKDETIEEMKNKQMKDEVRNKLIDKLVEFSSKVLFLANHEGLASPPGTSGVIVGGAGNITRGLFGDFFTDTFTPYRLLTPELAEAKKQQYVRILQAVGNSILFSANELRERERYELAGQRKIKAEISAVNLSHATDPKKVLKDLLEDLQSEKEKFEKKMVDADTLKPSLETNLTGLKAKEQGAIQANRDAQHSLDKYKNTNVQLKAVNEVLTYELVENIKKQWVGEGKENAANLTDFLKNSDGLSDKISNALKVKGDSPSPDVILKFENAENFPKKTSTEESFKARREQGVQKSMKFADLLDGFVEHIRRLEEERKDQEEKLREVHQQKESELNQIRKEIASQEKELKQVKALLTKLPDEAAAFENAKAKISEVKSSVLKAIEKHDQFVSPRALYLLIATHLSKAEEEAKGSDKKPFRDAQTILLGRTPPADGLPLDPKKDYKSPMAVMDDVIALLRHEQMMAVKRFGKASDQDGRATAALENAYQHRAGMIYIRPSSAYLRTSYPSTSLQDDPNLAWDNLLLQQGIRNLPFSSQVRDIFDPSVPRDRLLTSELDKQYWQNINRVRVSGTGFTNQVVAKDDVGNWYVKQYYGDTEDIVKSAKNLALFNLGTNLPIDLAGELKAATKPKTKPAGDSEGEAPAGGEAAAKLKDDTKILSGSDSPPLQRLLEKHRNAYQAKTTEVSTRLEGLHTQNGANTVHNQIVKAWKNIDELKGNADPMDALKAALDIAIQEWDEAAITLRKKPEQDPGQLILKDLWALSRLEKALSIKIQEIGSDPVKVEPDPLTPIKAKSIAEVKKVVGRLVLDILNDRKQTLDRYDQAIMFIGEAANSKSSP